MESIYLDPSKVGSFGGVRALARASKTSIRDVKKWLAGIDAYTLHKQPHNLHFRRRRTFANSIDDLWQADLIDVSNLSKENDEHKWILCVIDVLSKRAWAVALKNKSGATLRDAMQIVFNRASAKPNFLQTDKGTEFKNVTFQKLLTDNGVKFYAAQNNDIKASVIERWIRTLKTRMYRYFTHARTLRYLDVLHHLVTSYNNTVHSSIKVAPSSVDRHNEAEIRSRLFPPVRKGLKRESCKFLAGDHVRILQSRLPFQKSYLGLFSEEIFVVKKCVQTDPLTYRIKDLNDECIEGGFYAEELQGVDKKETFRVERVLKTRKIRGKKQYFVKWLGYSDKFNSWVDDIIE